MEQQLITGTVAGTGASINITLGFSPSAVEVWNPVTNTTLNWTSDMADASAVKYSQLADDQLLSNAEFKMSATNNAELYTRAFKFMIGGVPYSKAAISTSVSSTATVPANKYGIFGLQIGANGTLDARDAAANGTGYDSTASALASVSAVTGSHIAIGYVIVITTAGGGFIGATTEFDATGVTATFVPAQNARGIVTLGITPIDLGDSTTINGGFTIGADTDLNVSGDTLYYKAWR